MTRKKVDHKNTIDKELLDEEFPDKVLLESGLFGLDRSLESLMEMKSDEGKALANIVYGALVFGEKIFKELEEEDK